MARCGAFLVALLLASPAWTQESAPQESAPQALDAQAPTLAADPATHPLDPLPLTPPDTGTDAADIAEALRTAGLDPEQCYLVRDLSLPKDDIKLYFNDGYLIFTKPVAGERLSAIFAGTSEMADGEILLLPPRRGERQSLAKYTRTPNLDEHFHTALLAFTDGSGQALLDEIAAGGRGRPDPEAGAILAERWTPAITNLSHSMSQRLVNDLLSPVRIGGGFLYLALSSERLGNFDVIYDPLGDDQILAGQLKQRGGVNGYDVWTSFEAREFRTGAARREQRPFRLDHYRIQAFLDQNLWLDATTRATLIVGEDPVRALLFGVSRAETVSAVRIDGQPVEVRFQDSARGRALSLDENDIFLAVAPELLAPGSSHEIEFEHAGSVIVDSGSGVYAVGARSNWYPRGDMAFADYEIEFHYPRDLTLVTPGEIVDDRTEGAMRITLRRTPPIRVAGFNLGNYARSSIVTDGVTGGLTVNVYGNKGLDPALAPRPKAAVITAPRFPRPYNRGGRGETTTTILQTPVPPDPLARLEAVAADVSASLQYFTSMFGPPPLKTLTVSPIPGRSGQGFPGLIYLSTLAYLDPEERPEASRNARDKTFFSDLMAAHEVAHQWWGNIVTAGSYQDEWLMEALANYSAMLWIEKKKGSQTVEQMLTDFRGDLERRGADGDAVEAFGPLTWGYRLESAQDADTWRTITYEKGAWIFHMLRQRLGDQAFFRMLAALRERYQGRPVTTADVQKLVEEFLPPRTPADTAEVFFENWVYSTGLPELRVRYKTSGKAPSLRLSGTIEQEDAPSGFSVEVPVRIEFAKGAPRTVWVRSGDGQTAFSVTLRAAPTRVFIPPTAVLSR